MNIEQVLQTYDANYAEAYNEKFLLNGDSQEKANTEFEILTKILGEKGRTVRWLDVACGTGYFLSRFPEIQRAGLDISPAMLNIARSKNSDIPLIEGDFRNKSLVGKGQWDVISSMWWAYSLVESISDTKKLIENIAYWLADDGICFMPIGDASKLLLSGKIQIPHVATEDAGVYGGKILITGVIWSWIEPNGKRHDHMVLPQVEQMVEMFKEYFEVVETIAYHGGWYSAIIARKKKSQR